MINSLSIRPANDCGVGRMILAYSSLLNRHHLSPSLSDEDLLVKAFDGGDHSFSSSSTAINVALRFIILKRSLSLSSRLKREP